MRSQSKRAHLVCAWSTGAVRSCGLGSALLLLAACVTINVYFPAAQTEAAAREFVDKVFGPAEGEAKPAQPPAPATPATAPGFGRLNLLVGLAYAANADIDVQSPAIQAIQARMAERFAAKLAAAFDAGALGFAADGRIVIRDAAVLSLPQRAAVQQAVAADNRDRDAVYREIAVVNRHPEWEPEIRAIFARQWAERARAGWWYQDDSGSWRQK